MNKTKLVALSLMTAAALTMVGCGSSSTTTTPPVDTNDTNTTPPPVVVVPDYAKPASVNAISTQQLLVNTGALQASNVATATTESVTALLASLITQAGAITVINTGADVPCAAFGVGQGSGSISAEAHSLPNGTGYSINFNECTFDTANTLEATTEGLVPTACKKIDNKLENMLNAGKLNQNKIENLQDLAVECAESEYSYTLDRMGNMIRRLVRVVGLNQNFENNIPLETLDTLDALNDTTVINGTLRANVNITALPAGNIWDNTFSATNFNMSLYENESDVKKMNIDMHGDLSGNLNVDAVGPAFAVAMSGTNNLSAMQTVDSPSMNIFYDFGVVGDNSAHGVNVALNLDTTQAPGSWQEIASASFNDSGDGYVRGYFDDRATLYEGETSLYNNNFTQERTVVTDPSAILGTGVGRQSTYTMNGGFGMNTKGLAFVWNTQGAFTFNTTDTATKTKAVGMDYAIQSGLVQIAGDSTIELQFLPDLAPVQDGVQDGTVVLRVGTDITTIPMGTITWLEVFPQP